jgi:oligopeptidase B
MKWANAARRDHRHRSIEDYEAVIRDAQLQNKLGPRQTVIYGRSAGGIPVGAVVARHPDGTLVGAAYTEVPYVDVLRTTTNPALPLTVGEYKEFGNPRESILNMKELLSISPINTLPADGAPGVFVLSRVGLLDKQVYAYESFKWIQKLRGNYDTVGIEPKGKYVIFEMGEAHKYGKKRFIPTHASDLAILDSWMDREIVV